VVRTQDGNWRETTKTEWAFLFFFNPPKSRSPNSGLALMKKQKEKVIMAIFKKKKKLAHRSCFV
jgi:hypothetical protein